MGAELLGKTLASRDMRVEIAERRLGLLMEFVQDGDCRGGAFPCCGRVRRRYGRSARRRRRTVRKNRRNRDSTEENSRVRNPLFLRVAGSSPRALARMSDNNLPVAPSSRFCVWARIRSANSTTACWARSPNVTMRERSEMSISDLMRLTTDASAVTAGILMVSLIAFHPLGASRGAATWVRRCNFA